MPKSLNPPTSTIKIVYDGDEIQDYCLFRQCSFECQANAIPGTARIVVKDEGRTLSFVTGKELYLYIDDQLFWGGLVMRVSRQYAFAADDTTNLSSVKTRQWVLECSDFNIWFDKRVIHNPDNYTRAIITDGVHYDGTLIRDYLPNYIDVPPGLDISAPNVMDIAQFGERGNDEGVFQVRYAWVNQGTPWRKQMDEFAARSAAMYYINANKELIFQNLDRSSISWVFADYAHNNVWTNTTPIRDVMAQEDGSVIVNDALVWGGMEAEQAIYFARYQDDEAQDQYQRWQLAETRFQDGMTQEEVSLRAQYLVAGPPGADPFGASTGLRFPLWRFNLTWFAHDVPRVGGVPQHILPGNLVNIHLHVMGSDAEHPLIQFLPLRNLSVSFPQLKTAGEAWVQFTGEFGISYADSRYLWAYLLNRGRLTTQQILNKVNNSSVVVSGSKFGDFGTFIPNESPNGLRTVFTFPAPLLKDTVRVYVNALLWREGREYTITDTNEITFSVALASDDKIYVEARTGLG